jgi:predicted nucleic acid-binding protein
MRALVDPEPPRMAFEEDAAFTYVVNDPVASDFQLAAELVLRDVSLGLRGPDALHLAVAAGARVPILTLDRGLLAAARALGIEASDAGVLTG